VHGFDFDVDNPKPQEVAPPQHATGGTNGDKVVIVMVGMPGTGKLNLVDSGTFVEVRTVDLPSGAKVVVASHHG